MANLKIRSSKFRHVYGAQSRREHCFENVRITRNTHDSNFCCVNPNFLAVVLESSGGGAFAILDVNQPGRVDINCPRVCGHSGSVMDIKWNPFNDFIIASGSEDSTVKLWTIPQTGMPSMLTQWSADLHGHSRKVSYLEWHPTAENILVSVGFDKKIMIWNVEQAEPITSLTSHTDTIFSVSWGPQGSLLASTCKDKMIRVQDARSGSVVKEFKGHYSPKASKCVFVGDQQVFTTGFSQCSQRQYALWDLRKPDTAVSMQSLDSSSGIVLPYFDVDTKVVYMAGKGDGMIRYVEVQSDPSDLFFLSYYQSHLPQRGLGMMPKRGVNTSNNEVARFYKLHASKDLVEPVAMIAPRKAEGFHHDIYPPTHSNFASLTADQWTSGLNRGPILLNLEDGSIVNKPKTSMSSVVQSPISNLGKMPEITTYKTINKTNISPAHQTYTVSPPTSLRTSPDGFQASPEINEMPGYVSADSVQPIDCLPSSIKNIRRLSMNFENKPSNTSPHSPSPISSFRSTTPTSPSTNSYRSISLSVLNGAHQQPDHQQAIHVRKVWTPPVSPESPVLRPNTPSIHSDSELKKAYFRQLNEIQSLHDQLSIKDKRIKELETELTKALTEKGKLESEETDC